MSWDDFLIGFEGSLLGFSQEQIAQIEGQLPAIKRLVDLSNKTLPLIKQLEGYTAQAEKDWATVGPVVSMVLGVIKARTNH